MKAWMTEHNAAVMAVLFLVFGVGPDREGDRACSAADAVQISLALIARAAVGGDLAAGDPLRLVGRQPQRGVADVARVADPQ